VKWAEWKTADPEPPALKRASPAGRALVALAKRLGPHPGATTGIYQALGREKLLLTGRFAERVTTKGFAGMKATAPVLEYSGYGPGVSLALELGCRGPFWTLEADELAGGAALQQACTDLKLGRCARALVCSCGVDATATLLVLDEAPPLTITWSAQRNDLEPGDLHGLKALGALLERGSGAVQCRTPDGRGLTVALQAIS